tara:strand:- start:5585 stop:5806 length:222 start_codon:yes stop_codon:yes gene_type:complete
MWVRRKKIKAAQEAVENLTRELEKLKRRSMLIGIERKGRVNIFTFVRGEEIVQIEAMGMMNDPLGIWRKQLLE